MISFFTFLNCIFSLALHISTVRFKKSRIPRWWCNNLACLLALGSFGTIRKRADLIKGNRETVVTWDEHTCWNKTNYLHTRFIIKQWSHLSVRQLVRLLYRDLPYKAYLRNFHNQKTHCLSTHLKLRGQSMNPFMGPILFNPYRGQINHDLGHFL